MLVGPGFDLLDAALLDLCLEYILSKVPLKALACLTLASKQAHTLVLRATTIASFWEERTAIYGCITATRPTSKAEQLRIVEKASELVELSWFGVPETTAWRGRFAAREAAQLPFMIRALVSRLAPSQVIEMVQTLRPFKLRLTHPGFGLVSLEHELLLFANSHRRASWSCELVLQLARVLDQTMTFQLMEFASHGFGTVNPAAVARLLAAELPCRERPAFFLSALDSKRVAGDPVDVARLFAADLLPSERPAFYVTALSSDNSASPAIAPLVALAQGEPLQFVFDTITAFAAADEQELQDPFYEAEHAECFAAGFVEAWAREVDFPHSWSVPGRLAVAHAVTSCNEVAKKGLWRIVLRWLPSKVKVPMRPPITLRGLPACLGPSSGPERERERERESAFGCRTEAVTTPLGCLAKKPDFAI